MVRHHSVTLPIYTSLIHGKTRYTIAFYRDGRRQRRCFTDLDAAKKEAKQIAEKILRGMQSQNDLKPAEREAWFAAQRILEQTDIPLVAALEDYVQCRKPSFRRASRRPRQINCNAGTEFEQANRVACWRLVDEVRAGA